MVTSQSILFRLKALSIDPGSTIDEEGSSRSAGNRRDSSGRQYWASRYRSRMEAPVMDRVEPPTVVVTQRDAST